MSHKQKSSSQYESSGVSGQGAETALEVILEHLLPTWKFNPGYPVSGGRGYYANIINIGRNQGIAFCTDGVGTKIVLAELLSKYDTIGIDCVAMNVNDVICVGAQPVSMVDYIACSGIDKMVFEAIGKGLAEGARQASISISGGEISQIREIINGIDLMGACIGHIRMDRVNTGSEVKAGNIIVGLESSGVHSNGLTLARKVLLGDTLEEQRDRAGDYSETLGTTLGLELLKPTRIYVPEILEMMDDGIDLKAIIHITGGGFCNLNRVAAQNIRFVLDNLPDPQPVFNLIQSKGNVSDSEMHEVFNMGIGMCVVIDGTDAADKIIATSKKYGTNAQVIGYVETCDAREVSIPRYQLNSRGGSFNLP